MTQKLNYKQNFNVEELAKTLESELTSQFGPVLSDERLSQALGYPTLNAFRRALSRNTVSVPVFTIPNQRGKHALVKDVARWLAAQRGTVTNE